MDAEDAAAAEALVAVRVEVVAAVVVRVAVVLLVVEAVVLVVVVAAAVLAVHLVRAAAAKPVVVADVFLAVAACLLQHPRC